MLFWNKKKKEKNPEAKPRKVTGDAKAPVDEQKVTSSPGSGRKRSRKAKEVAAEPAQKQRSHIPVDVKLAAVEARAAGLSAREVAELAGVCVESVEQWCKAHEKRGWGPASRLSQREASWESGPRRPTAPSPAAWSGLVSGRNALL